MRAEEMDCQINVFGLGRVTIAMDLQELLYELNYDTDGFILLDRVVDGDEGRKELKPTVINKRHISFGS